VDKTAFVVPQGQFAYIMMPFGLTNAPPVFQRIMTWVLAGVENCCCYLDDVLIAAPTLEETIAAFENVCERFRQHGLLLNMKKCKFFKKEIVYLGFKLTDKGILPDDSHVKAIAEFPVPRTVKQVQRFLGMAGFYRRFIKILQKSRVHYHDCRESISRGSGRPLNKKRSTHSSYQVGHGAGDATLSRFDQTVRHQL
jgi:hypothetical protein